MEDRKILLWLDDTRNPEEHAPKEFPIEDIVWVKSYDAFAAYLDANPMPHMISFDYMLGTGENMFTDGIGCAKAVIRKCTKEEVPWPRYRIHSTFDTVGKLRKYIEHAIYMYELGDAVEEDRQPNTEIQQAFEDAGAYGGEKKQVVVEKTRSVGITGSKYFGHQAPAQVPIRSAPTQSRNAACACGSGKKYKHCCMKK